ncbi:TetR/AcrR family transcriptional regulator [Spongiactinospora rosea]|uniref:TetR/AcrR family transcriptional regulator n=1 Tax=Spongiactinospora rosea TaxID=2248750 RepID=UPI0018F4D8CC|nr:TetR/AcrR family transcriptional regulator [Spongiactinospora rosea]
MTTARGRGRPRDPQTDAAILRAALELFIERGVEGTSIEQIAKRAGVGKLTVYRRWSGKEELIAQAVEQTVPADLVPSPEDVETMTPHEIIERILPAAAETTASPEFRALTARMMGSAVSHPSLMAAYWKHHILPRRDLAMAMLRHAQQNGTVSPDADPDVLIDMMAGAVTWRVLQPDPPDAAEMLRYIKAVYHQIGLYHPTKAP